MLYRLNGRIDTSNAAEFEKDLLAAAGTENIELDAENLEYISSAGLRVLLKLRKQQGKLKVINVNSDVYEILEVTGFSEMLEVKKALRTISLEGCEIIGKGGLGTVYKYDDETVVKLYAEHLTFEEIESERKYAKAAFIAGVPTAIPFDMVKVGKQYGNVYELMASDTLSNAFLKQPEKYDELIEKYANLVKSLAATKAEVGDFDSYKSVMLGRCSRIYDIFGDEVGKLVEEAIECMPEEGCIIHGDLHPGNIMLQNGELMLIDMADVTVGPSIYELVAIYRDMGTEKSPQADEAMFKSTGMHCDMTMKIWNDLFAKLMEDKPKEVIEQTMGAIQLINSLLIVVMLTMSRDELVKELAPNVSNILIDPVIKPNIETIKQVMTNAR